MKEEDRVWSRRRPKEEDKDDKQERKRRRNKMSNPNELAEKGHDTSHNIS